MGIHLVSGCDVGRQSPNGGKEEEMWWMIVAVVINATTFRNKVEVAVANEMFGEEERSVRTSLRLMG